ncbi:uncharacterized protein LOC125655750 [Ostrea edulis]|uniref:uncharacterized protein LOC125655750 n=1 Tax=Ostrea edulis TaxID=37623 RepID=UPI0024AE93BE|nr:uncharacterized protein LOC125655750 [Ostrea edulis]XP_056005343.1 uncharacterized protein LOC125655750 [Ostrea edulis]XP_056005350.1 uncharacterized protein LOC125655750 [Ostrea edulis]
MTMSLSSNDNESDLKEMKNWSSFYLDEDIRRISNKRLKERLEKLIKDIDVGFDTTEENVCIHNFVSYLYWSSDEKEEAFEFAKKALQLGKTCPYTSLGGTENLVTIGNLCNFYKESGDIVLVKAFVKQFKTLSKREDFQELKYIAKAELAICLSKLGSFYSRKAIKMFRDSVDKMSNTLNCWQFYFAITLRRKSHLYTIQNIDDAALIGNTKEAFEKFLKIISNNSLVKLKSRSWCQIGILLHGTPDLARTDPHLNTYRDLNYITCFKNALKIYPQSYHVLQQYGKHLRYKFMFRESKEMLEKSLEIRETSTAYHHLALTLQKMVLQEHYEKKKAKLRRNSEPTKVSSAKNTTDDTECNRKRHRESMLKRKLKSPRWVPQYPEHHLLWEAEQHLQKAIKLDVTFHTARHDLGLVQRMLGKSETALKNFRDITHAKTPSRDHFPLLIAYEQQAFCRFDIDRKNGDEKESENAEDALWNALSIISIYIDIYPELKNVCSTIEELRNIVERDTAHPEKEAKFHEKLKDREKALKSYSKCPESEEKYMKMVENYLADRNFRKAIGLLDQLIVNKNPFCPSGEFLFQTYMEGAKYSLTNRNFEDVKIRLMQTLRYIPAWEKYYENDIDVDFHIIHECGERCPRAEKLLEILARSKFIKWNVTLNAVDCLPGKREEKYYEDTLETAKFILLFLHDKPSECHDEHLKIAQQNAIVFLKEKTLRVILGNAGQPSNLSTINLPPNTDTVEDGDEDSDMVVLEARIICDILQQIFQRQTKGTCCKKMSRHEP